MHANPPVSLLLLLVHLILFSNRCADFLKREYSINPVTSKVRAIGAHRRDIELVYVTLLYAVIADALKQSRPLFTHLHALYTTTLIIIDQASVSPSFDLLEAATSFLIDSDPSRRVHVHDAVFLATAASAGAVHGPARRQWTENTR